MQFLLFLAASASLSTAFVVPRAEKKTDSGKLVLKPIHPKTYLSAVHRRAEPSTSSDLNVLNPAESAHLVWGAESNGGTTMTLANMTLFAPEGQPIVHTEAFDHLTDTVTCHDHEGLMALKFSNKEAFRFAYETWAQTVNDDPDAKMIVVVNEDSCGPTDERAVYIIDQAHLKDEENLIIHLESEQAEWEEVAQTFNMDFGEVEVAPGAATRMLQRRSEKTIEFPIHIGSKGVSHTLYQNSQIKVSCSECFISGSLRLTGRLEVGFFSLKKLSLELNPRALTAVAAITTDITINGPKYAPEPYKIIPDTPIPEAGISIAHIFDLGAFVALEAGFEVQASARALFTVGMNVTVPSDAKIVLDMANMSGSGAPGWGGTKVTPFVDVLAADVTIHGSTWLRPKIALEAAVTKLGRAEAAVGLNLPKIAADASLKYNEKGVCTGSRNKRGLVFDIGAEVDLVLSLSGHIKGVFDKDWEKEVLALQLPHKSFCYPFGS